ncbi:hypothetical protein AB685_24115 [Bacillus sp. LL01]|uniref:GAF domain-containing sensor histidine kinase n=1 Tax=Bacillus sp. LL01 TaxID=1665556 RepID=UPI00064D4978|nr:GAF domain-containing sensor histidine kinase [Bacillus sp. LL01]KMJ56034.1 hypothetical protein AB685_24115 [Bacillus sp. LL01]
MNVVHTLKTIAETLNIGDDLHTMLQSVLESLLEVTNHETGWIFLVDDNDHQLIAHHRLPQALTADQCALMCQGSCWCKDKFIKGHLQRAANIMECRRMERAINKGNQPTNGLTHHATVPIVAGDEAYGLINIASRGKEHFSKEELEVLETVALQVGTTVKRLKLEEKKREIVRMEERHRLARDLHDSVNQLLFSLSLTAKSIKGVSEKQKVNEAVELMSEVSNEALLQLKQIIWQMRSEELEDGLIPAIHRYAALLDIKVDVFVEDQVRLHPHAELHLWRIIQEAINNSRKHSGLNSVRVHFTINDQAILVEIIDHGIGFERLNMNIHSGMGLRNMEERAIEIGGEFALKSEMDKGTTIQVRIPLEGREDHD